MLHTCLNNFPVFRNHRYIDFTLRCMDVSDLNELIDVNFYELEAEDFQATFHILLAWPDVGAGAIEKF